MDLGRIGDSSHDQVIGNTAHRKVAFLFPVEQAQRTGVGAVENGLAQRIIERDKFPHGDATSVALRRAPSQQPLRDDAEQGAVI